MKFFKNCLFAIVALMLVTSCNKVENKMESQIPADALLVVKANVPQLVENLGVEVKDGQMVLPQKFSQMLTDMGVKMDEFKAESGKLLESGIDFKHSIYAFMPNVQLAKSGDFTLVAMIPVADEAKFKDYLAKEMKVTLEEKEGLPLATQSGTTYALKDGIFYCAAGNVDNPAAKLNALASLEKNMSDNKAIVKALDASDDVNLYVDTKNLLAQVKESAGNMGGAQGQMAGVFFDLLDVKSSAYHLSFAGDEWNFRCENEVDDNSDFMKLVNSVTSKPSADLLAFMPKAGNMGAFSVSLNGEGIANLEMVKSSLNQLGNDPQINKMVDIFKSINGPVTIGFASETLSVDDMDIAIAFKCGKANDLLAMIKEMAPADIYTQKGDEFELHEQVNGFTATMGVKDGAVYIKLTHKAYADNMAAVAEAKKAIGDNVSGAYCFLSLENMQMQFVGGGKDVKESKATMWVKEDGKKLNALDALTFFMRLSSKMKDLAPAQDLSVFGNFSSGEPAGYDEEFNFDETL